MSSSDLPIERITRKRRFDANPLGQMMKMMYDPVTFFPSSDQWDEEDFFDRALGFKGIRPDDYRASKLRRARAYRRGYID